MNLSLSANNLDSKVIQAYLQHINKEQEVTLNLNQNEVFLRVNNEFEISQPLNIVRYLNNTLNKGSDFVSRTNAIENAEIVQWVSFCKVDLLQNLENKPKKEVLLKLLEKELSLKTFIVGNSASVADLFLYVYLNNTVQQIHEQKKEYSYLNISRYYNFLNQVFKSQKVITPISLFEGVREKELQFVPRVTATTTTTATATATQPATTGKKDEKKEEKKDEKKDAKQKDEKVKDEKPKEQKEQPKAQEVSVSVLDIRVGKILSARRHENAEKLYVEEIDVGEAKPRTVCSGLVGKIEMETKVNTVCLLCCNLEPTNMRGITSEAMVLAATNEKGEVELVKVPEGFKVGERIVVDKHKGEPEAKVNSKKLAKILPNLKTNAKGEVVYAEDDAVFRLSSTGGVITSSFANAVVK